MKQILILILMLGAVLQAPLTAQAKSSAVHAKKTMAAMYECSICHHRVSAAKAKSLHYTCPDDHGKLVPVKTASLHK